MHMPCCCNVLFMSSYPKCTWGIVYPGIPGIVSVTVVHSLQSIGPNPLMRKQIYRRLGPPPQCPQPNSQPRAERSAPARPTPRTSCPIGHENFLPRSRSWLSRSARKRSPGLPWTLRRPSPIPMRRTRRSLRVVRTRRRSSVVVSVVCCDVSWYG